MVTLIFCYFLKPVNVQIYLYGHVHDANDAVFYSFLKTLINITYIQ